MNDEINQIDVAKLLLGIWEKKHIIFASMIVVLFFGVSYSLWTPSVYRAPVLLFPTLEENSRGLSAITGQLSGIASLTGINLPSENQKKDKSLAILRSKQFIVDFIDENNLKPKIMYKQWDEEYGQWKQPGLIKKIIFDVKNLVEDQGEIAVEPSDLDVYERFVSDHIDIYEDKKTGMVTVGISAYSPEDAYRWATLLVDKINDYIKMRDKDQAEKSVEFLEREIQNTNIVSVQKTLYELIQVNVKTLVMANVKSEYAFEIIDGPMIPEKKIWPKRTLICLFSIFFGAFVGVLIAVYKS